MILPNVVPGQHADELVGLASGGAVVATVLNNTYTVPNGYTLVIHGFSATALANVSATLTIGGVTVFSGTMAAGSTTTMADRHRMAYTGGNGLAAITNAVTSGAPASNTLYTGGAANVHCAEHAPFLFWPLAAGQTIVSNSTNCVFYFWGTLIPT